MKNVFKTITVLAITLLTSTYAQAESLRCREPHTFRTATLFINRDGFIGFNGTYIELVASWFNGTDLKDLSQLTGRPADESFGMKAFTLNLSPKGSCTANNDSLSQDFSCLVKQARVDVTVGQRQNTTDGSIVQFEDLTKRVRVLVDVDLKAQIQVVNPLKRTIQMQAVLTNAKNGKQIKLDERMDCVVE